jgi:signal peptidase II
MLSFVDGWGLMAISAVIIVFVLYLAVRTEPGHVFARTGFALIVGGAAGNLVDRALLDHVVDYVLFHTPVWSFAVFNLADAFITVGAGLVILQELLNWHAERKVKS